MYHGTIIQIDDCLVSEEILTEYFACDYEKCKGCCCVIGDSGAPMEECEAEAIEKNYHIFSPIMSDEGRAAVAEKGFFEIDRDGDMVTPLVPLLSWVIRIGYSQHEIGLRKSPFPWNQQRSIEQKQFPFSSKRV